MGLTFQQKLASLGFASYEEYLRAPHWQKVKWLVRMSQRIRKLRKRYGGLVCEFCKWRGLLQYHHRTYERLGREYVSDIAVICERCHKGVHKLDQKRPDLSLEEATARYRSFIRRRRFRKAAKVGITKRAA